MTMQWSRDIIDEVELWNFYNSTFSVGSVLFTLLLSLLLSCLVSRLSKVEMVITVSWVSLFGLVTGRSSSLRTWLKINSNYPFLERKQLLEDQRRRRRTPSFNHIDCLMFSDLTEGSGWSRHSSNAGCSEHSSGCQTLLSSESETPSQTSSSSQE